MALDNDSISLEVMLRQLFDLGVIQGGVLVVHCAFSKVKPVENGPNGLIEALQLSLGKEGTLVMPSMSDDDDHPFDPKVMPCDGMGIVADTFWRLPGVIRSDSPHAFAAFGPKASMITAPHPLDLPHGPNSPIGRVHDMDGQILLLGVGHDANTTIHLAEYLADVRYRRKKHVMALVEGRLARINYREIDHCCQNFKLVDAWLDEQGLQRRGVVGHAKAGLINARDIVNVVVSHLIKNKTVFLHPPGVDEECDEARASLLM